MAQLVQHLLCRPKGLRLTPQNLCKKAGLSALATSALGKWRHADSWGLMAGEPPLISEAQVAVKDSAAIG